jgi:hypothetical protein
MDHHTGHHELTALSSTSISFFTALSSTGVLEAKWREECACVWEITTLAKKSRNEESAKPCLVDELVEGVLAVGAGLAEVDLAGAERQRGAVDGDPLAVV